MYGFLNQQCGLVNKTNACRCERKTHGFIEKGIVNPDRPQLIDDRLVEIRRVSPDRFRDLEELERLHAEIFRDQPLLTPRNQAALLRELLQSSGIRESMELGQ